MSGNRNGIARLVASALALLAAPVVALAQQPVAPSAQGSPAKVQGAPAKDAAGEKNGYVEIYDVRDLLVGEANNGVPFLSDVPLLGRLFTNQGDAAGADRPAPVDRGAEHVGPGEFDLRTGSVVPKESAPTAELQKSVAERATLLRTWVQGLAAKVEPACTCEMKESGAMVVRASAAMHQKIAAFLGALRLRSLPGIKVEMKFFDLDDAGRIDLAKRVAAAPPKSGSELQVSLLDPDLVAAYLREKGPASEFDRCPSVITTPLAPFSLMAGTEVSYVAGMESVQIEGIGAIVDPVIKQLFEGMVVRGRVVAAEVEGSDAMPFALRLDLEVSVLKRPIATAQCDLGTYQLPEQKTATIGTTLAGSVGSTFLVGGVPAPAFGADDSTHRRLYLLVTVGKAKPAGK